MKDHNQIIAEREMKNQLGTAAIDRLMISIYRSALSIAAKRFPELAQQVGVVVETAEVEENKVPGGDE